MLQEIIEWGQNKSRGVLKLFDRVKPLKIMNELSDEIEADGLIEIPDEDDKVILESEITKNRYLHKIFTTLGKNTLSETDKKQLANIFTRMKEKDDNFVSKIMTKILNDIFCQINENYYLIEDIKDGVKRIETNLEKELKRNSILKVDVEGLEILLKKYTYYIKNRLKLMPDFADINFDIEPRLDDMLNYYVKDFEQCDEKEKNRLRIALYRGTSENSFFLNGLKGELDSLSTDIKIKLDSMAEEGKNKEHLDNKLKIIKIYTKKIDSKLENIRVKKLTKTKNKKIRMDKDREPYLEDND